MTQIFILISSDVYDNVQEFCKSINGDEFEDITNLEEYLNENLFAKTNVGDKTPKILTAQELVEEINSTVNINYFIALVNVHTYNKDWDYSISTNTIWTNFDSGTVKAPTYEKAKEKAIAELNYNFSKANDVFKTCDVTIGFKIEFDVTQLQLTENKK